MISSTRTGFGEGDPARMAAKANELGGCCFESHSLRNGTFRHFLGTASKATGNYQRHCMTAQLVERLKDTNARHHSGHPLMTFTVRLNI